VGGGDAAKAAALLDDALALWHGPALVDLPDRASEAVRWDMRRLEARRTRLTAALALGRTEDALPELAALCDEFPLDEPLHALRIRALRDAARTAEALAAYDEVRRGLADRLGADPGPELRGLHEELLHAGEPYENPSSGPRPEGARPGRSWDGRRQRAYEGRHPGRPAAAGAAGRRGERSVRTSVAARTAGGQRRCGRQDSRRCGTGTADRAAGGRTARGAGGAGGGHRRRGSRQGTVVSVAISARAHQLRRPGGRHRRHPRRPLPRPPRHAPRTGWAGKTRLSQEAAERASEAWPDGVGWPNSPRGRPGDRGRGRPDLARGP